MSATAGNRYTAVAIGLHWLMAAAIVGMIGLGLYMTRLPRIELGFQFRLYQLHKSIGITVLLLSFVRLAWRLSHPVPPLPDTLKPWEAVAARASHIGFYVLMIAIPLAGWAMVSASPLDIPTRLFGLIPWPHLPVLDTLPDKKSAEAAFKFAHRTLAYGAVALLGLHVGAALKHHFILKDDVLTRMIPALKPRKRS